MCGAYHVLHGAAGVRTKSACVWVSRKAKRWRGFHWQGQVAALHMQLPCSAKLLLLLLLMLSSLLLAVRLKIQDHTSAAYHCCCCQHCCWHRRTSEPTAAAHNAWHADCKQGLQVQSSTECTRSELASRQGPASSSRRIWFQGLRKFS